MRLHAWHGQWRLLPTPYLARCNGHIRVSPRGVVRSLEKRLNDVVDIERALSLRGDGTSFGAGESTSREEAFVHIVRRGELMKEVLKNIRMRPNKII